MKAKRSKQYRKLMQQYGLVFAFREPYQILVDAQIIQDVISSKMDLAKGLERTLHGQIKPMITQCSIRHLYALPLENSASHKHACIDLAKQFERRRCNHHTLDEPLSTLGCFKDVIDPKESSTNKNRYVVATQDEGVRQWCQTVRGVPIVYVFRSVMLMKHMADSSKDVRLGVEKEKLRAGIKAQSQKRKRNELEDSDKRKDVGGQGQDEVRKRKRIKGPKGPNPLSVRKSKKKDVAEVPTTNAAASNHQTQASSAPVGPEETLIQTLKAKRKRKHKSGQATLEKAEELFPGD